MYWEQMTTRQFEAAMGKVSTAILPTGTVEAHGFHCPLGTDNIAPAELARRLERRHPDELLVAPAVPFGHSWDLEEWPGTLSIPAAALENYVAEVGLAMSRWGIRHLILVNGHGGNNGALGHAGEDETSVMLALAPSAVEMAHAGVNPYRPKFRFKDQAARKTVLRHAVTGDGRHGTREKGERILELVEARLEQMLQDLWADQLFHETPPR